MSKIVTVRKEIADRESAVRRSRASSFRDLVVAADLEPSKHLRFKDLSELCFENQDLRKMDFTGARLAGSTFAGAKIEGARFGQAVTAELCDGFSSRFNLSKAQDWLAYCSEWTPAQIPSCDGHLRDGDLFRDAPFSPDMLVFGARNAAPYAPMSNQHGTPKVTPLSYSLAIALAPLSLQEYHWFKSRSEPAAAKAKSMQRLPSEIALITWQEANNYIDWLSEQTEHIYRLPSESEWELSMQQQVLQYNTEQPIWEYCEDDWEAERPGPLDDAEPYEGDDDRVRVIRLMKPQGPNRLDRMWVKLDGDKQFALRIVREMNL